MVAATKINGYILTRHFANEGTKANWQGMHQWNFYIEKNSLIVCNSSGNSVNILDTLQGSVQVVNVSDPNADLYIFDMKRCK